MAEGKIKYSDLFDADLVEKIASLKKEMASLRESANQIKTAIPKTGSKAGDTEKLNKAQAERIRLQERLNSLENEEAKANLQLKQQIADKLRQKKEEIKLNGQSESSMQKMSAKLRDLKKQYSQLSAEERKNAQVGGVMLRNIQAQDRELTRLNGTMGDHQRKVGNYTGALKNFGSQLMGALGITAGLTMLVSAFKNAINTSKDFEKALSSLSAITGAIGKDLQFYKEKAMEYANATLLSAGDILKAFEKVGSIRPELLKTKEALAEVTLQAVILSEATGGTLGVEDAAIAAAGAMNQFGIASRDAAKVADVLVAAQTYGTATVSQLAETFANFGVVAKDSNLTLIQGAALAEVLGNKMIVGAEAGTKLTSTLINLKNAGVGYASGQFDVSDALQEVKDKVDALGSAYEKDQLKIEIFGKRNITVGTILLDNISKYEELTTQLDVNGIALEKQKTQNDNLSGSIGILGSTWDNFILSLSGSSGVLRGIVDTTNKFITGITLAMKHGVFSDFWEEEAKLQQAALDKTEDISKKQLKLTEDYNTAVERGYIELGTTYEQYIQNRVDQFVQMGDEEKTNNQLALESELAKIKELEKINEEAAKRKAEKLKEELKKEEEDIRIANAAISEAKVKQMQADFQIELEKRKQDREYLDFQKQLESDLNDFEIELMEETDKMSEEYFQKTIDRRLKDAKDIEEKAKKELEIRKAVENGKLDAVLATTDLLKSISGEQSAIFKAAAIAETTVNTYKAAQAAYTSALAIPVIGLTLAPIMAAIAVAAGLANVAKITGVKFERGEVDIQGRRHSQGGIPAEIEGGESVINRTGTARSKETLELINSGLISDKDIIPALALNFARVPNMSVNNDFSKIVTEQQQTNALLKKFKFMSADGKKVMDINGNLLRYV